MEEPSLLPGIFSKVRLEKMCGKFIDTESPCDLSCDPCTEKCVPITEYFVPLEILKTQKSLENKGFIAMCSPYPFI